MEGTKQQISKLINKSNNILVATPEHIDGDALGSAFALAGALENIGKNVKLVIPNELPPKFHFLPKKNSLSHNSLLEREFVLSVDNPEDHINELYYEKENGLLHIYLKGKKVIEEKHFRIKPSYPFDLIFTINARDFENLGQSFEHNPELFFETPVINIDNHPENGNFGEINLVDIAFSSVSELILEIIDFLDRNLINKEIATWILTGLIDATDNFQSLKTTPRTFNNAALLINRGANQQEIIRYLYKTKSLNFLRLWGRVLHKLSWDENKNLVWGNIEQEDFKQTNTEPTTVHQIVDEIKAAFPNTKTVLLFWEKLQQSSNKDMAQFKTEGLIYSVNSELIKQLSIQLNGTLKNSNLLFEASNKSLEEAENQLRNLIDEQI